MGQQQAWVRSVQGRQGRVGVQTAEGGVCKCVYHAASIHCVWLHLYLKGLAWGRDECRLD